MLMYAYQYILHNTILINMSFKSQIIWWLTLFLLPQSFPFNVFVAVQKFYLYTRFSLQDDMSNASDLNLLSFNIWYISILRYIYYSRYTRWGIIVWIIQNSYINVLLTCTEIVGNSTTIRSLPRSNMRWLCISWNSFFVIFGGSCRSCIFFFRKDCFRLFRILRPMKSFSSFKWK